MSESGSGARGGWDRFEWKSVKDDKYRENYLGNSIKAPVGRWQKGKDLTWYSKPKQQRNDLSILAKKPGSNITQEIRMIKEKEAKLFLEALTRK